jgi:hypothetical protein
MVVCLDSGEPRRTCAMLLQTAAEFLLKEVDFVSSLYQAAELEVRTTERYVLVTLGGIYSYLASKDVPGRFRRPAWYVPTFVVVFAGLRALGLGLRQCQLLQWLKTTEAKALVGNVDAGWVQSFTKGAPIVAGTATAFYVVLTILTLVIAWRATRSSSD